MLIQSRFPNVDLRKLLVKSLCLSAFTRLNTYLGSCLHRPSFLFYPLTITGGLRLAKTDRPRQAKTGQLYYIASILKYVLYYYVIKEYIRK